MPKKNSESGHAINLGKMASTVSIVESLGATFQPAHEDIKPDALRTYFGDCDAAQTDVKNAEDAYDRAVNARRDAYAGLRKLATRVINAYVDAGASAADVEDARAVNRKLQGGQPKPAKDPGQDAEGKQNYSTSQQSFISVADHFDFLLRRVGSFAGYAPTDADLKKEALEDVRHALSTHNSAVDRAAMRLRDARDARKRLFYDGDRGMTARSQRLRSYFKTRPGGIDPLKGIRFRRLE
ncbi:MAG: hypothetical protein EOP04_08125 [Proteobacteria bacterium]|nr:MAG: hypothetical protein EOP04_08125 [Pseudomonadota bacterium]